MGRWAWEAEWVLPQGAQGNRVPTGPQLPREGPGSLAQGAGFPGGSCRQPTWETKKPKQENKRMVCRYVGDVPRAPRRAQGPWVRFCACAIRGDFEYPSRDIIHAVGRSGIYFLRRWVVSLVAESERGDTGVEGLRRMKRVRQPSPENGRWN